MYTNNNSNIALQFTAMSDSSDSKGDNSSKTTTTEYGMMFQIPSNTTNTTNPTTTNTANTANTNMIDAGQSKHDVADSNMVLVLHKTISGMWTGAVEVDASLINNHNNNHNNSGDSGGGSGGRCVKEDGVINAYLLPNNTNTSNNSASSNSNNSGTTKGIGSVGSIPTKPTTTNTTTTTTTSTHQSQASRDNAFDDLSFSSSTQSMLYELD